MEVSASSSQLELQIDGENKVNVRIKVVGSGGNAVAAESKLVGAHWVVLDKNLKQETKQCLEELHCNIAVMTKGSHAKVLRLNLGDPSSSSLPFNRTIKHPTITPSANKHLTITPSANNNVKANSSLGQNGAGASSSSSFKDELPKVIFQETNPLFERFDTRKLISSKEDNGAQMVDSDQEYAPSIQNCIKCYNESTKPQPLLTTKSRLILLQDQVSMTNCKHDAYKYYTDPREAAVSFVGISSPSYSSPRPPPPLCSLCRHKAPLFGKPPRQFTYQELFEATSGFSDENFLGEDSVYKGVLLDGQLVAVKQLLVVDDYDDDLWEEDYEFRSQVESLSRAQHKNVVMLLGFCIEGRRRLLVYEYVCNGSLDHHLHGGEETPLNWRARVKIAAGAARGLRYLHEDCRVGLVHGGLRSKNILLTHDFEPMIGGFSLAKCQTKRSLVTETRAFEAFGYQAPEYIEHGIMTEKADMYAFGVVLLEILSGRKAIDMTQPKGKQLLTEWAHPILSLALQGNQTVLIDQFLDPCLDRDQACNNFSSELHAMYCAAVMCLRLDPHTRPSMSKVLKVFEGDVFIDPGSNINLVGSKSSRMNNYSRLDPELTPGSVSLRFPYEVTTNALHEDRN